MDDDKEVAEMAILTGAGMNKILRRIMEHSDLTAEMANDFQRLKDDFDERTSYLSRIGEVYVGDDVDEYDFSPNDATNTYTEKEVEGIETNWENRYNELKKQYLDRFFGGVEPGGTNIQTIMDDTVTDVQRDGEPQTFDELLDRTEG